LSLKRRENHQRSSLGEAEDKKAKKALVIARRPAIYPYRANRAANCRKPRSRNEAKTRGGKDN